MSRENYCNAGLLMIKDRLAAARTFLQQWDVSAILFSDRHDIRYLSGYTGEDGFLLLADAESFLLTDSRYTTQASRETDGCTVVGYRDRFKDLARIISDTTGGRVGFQSADVSHSFYVKLSEALPALQLVPMDTELVGLRAVKDEGEIEAMRTAASIASESLLSVMDTITPGVRERDIALALEFAMRSNGAEDRAFDIIVASGERGALPHGVASGKCLQPGELVTIDFGAVFDGYHSDETVTVALGEPGRKHREIYQIVKDAHDMALEKVKPGVSFKEIDSVARAYIHSKGYGEYFGHGLGHGVGLHVHERPLVSPRSTEVVLEGMVFTIEPGIYLPGWGGVRIEDTVCAASDGCFLLTGIGKDLRIL